MSDVQTSSTYSAPSGYEPKWYIGNIISQIFDVAWRIQNQYISAFQIIQWSFANNIPKWDWQKFVASSISEDVSWNVWIGSISNSSNFRVYWDIVANNVTDPSGNSIWGKFEDGTNTQDAVFSGAGKRYVGINTLTPTNSLEVNGDARITGWDLYIGSWDQKIAWDDNSAIFIDSNNDTNTQMILRDKQDLEYGRIYGSWNGWVFGLLDGDGNWSYRAEKDNNTRFYIDNSEKMRILSNGNVGIGTTNPIYTLDVNGKIRMQWGTSASDGNNIVATKGYVDDYSPNIRQFANSTRNSTITFTWWSWDLCALTTVRIDDWKWGWAHGAEGCYLTKNASNWTLRNSETEDCQAICVKF